VDSRQLPALTEADPHDPNGDPMSTVTSSDGTTIAFSRTGTGPPIVMVDARSLTGRSTRRRQRLPRCSRLISGSTDTTVEGEAKAATRCHTPWNARSRTSRH
jgi:hypothetical protein